MIRHKTKIPQIRIIMLSYTSSELQMKIVVYPRKIDTSLLPTSHITLKIAQRSD